MDIAKINELLNENEKIKQKIIELKRKLNLKNYTKIQKGEFEKLIKVLQSMFYSNQNECVSLSQMSATQFAEIVKKTLNKNNYGNYEIKFQLLEFDKNNIYGQVLKHFNKEKRCVYLVVANKNAPRSKILNVNDINNIPISYLDGMIKPESADEYIKFLLEQKKMSIFEDVCFDEEWQEYHSIKTFNLGKPSVEDKTRPAQIRKLCELIKQELGIYNTFNHVEEKQQ